MGSTNIGTQQQFDSEVQGMISNGRDNMVGQAIFKGLDMLCPISTSTALAIAEQPELRAYKLGKQKCSYNQVELVIKDVSSTGKPAELKVSEAIETCVGPEVDEQLRDSCLKFNVRFVNNNRMHLYIYVVYATPYSSTTSDKPSVTMYHWIPVTRSKCRKGCKGPVIRGLQRFGRMPRRNATTLDGEDSWKEPRHLYIAIDEASTHVCPRHETSKFRLLIAAYDDKNQLLGTTVSTSIRVLANNDAPLGAASFKLHCHVKGGWGAGSVENASPPRSHIITDEKLTRVQRDRVMLIDDKEVDHEVLSVYKIRHTFPADDGPRAYPNVDKEHTLTDLCYRLFKFCVAKQEDGQTTVTLRWLANILGARRRRVYEILNVLETIQVIHDLGKERYTWIGSRKIAGTLVKLKNSIPRVGEATDTSRTAFSPIRRSKFKTALPRHIEEMRSETATDPLRTLSKRFIQLFLLHEGYAVPWEQVLQSIVDGQGQDPETMRAKRRRLGEIARIFSALHLIKRACNQKLKSGLVYEWLGTQGVADHLYSISCSGFVDGRSTRTHQERVKSPMTQAKRGAGGLRGRSIHAHDIRSRQVTGHIHCGEVPSELEVSIPHQISPTSRWGVQAASLPAKSISNVNQRIHQYQSNVPHSHLRQMHASAFQQRRELFDVGILHTPCSSETEDEDFPSLENADEGSAAIERCTGEHVTCQLSGVERSEQDQIPKIMSNRLTDMHVLDHLVSEPTEPRDRLEAAHRRSSVKLEQENKLQPSCMINTPVTSEDHMTSGVSCSTAQQFPYKKRKFDVTSFTCCAESNESDRSRDSKLSSPSIEHDQVPQDYLEFNRPSTFDPLFHLFCFYSPERIFELQSQNPVHITHRASLAPEKLVQQMSRFSYRDVLWRRHGSFLFTYVKESRAFYNRWCAQNAGPTLIRPVANVGKISIDDSGVGIPFSISRHCPVPNVFFAAREQGSDLKVWLLKRRSRVHLSSVQIRSSSSANPS